MNQPVIKRQLIWPVSLRLTHGIIALCITGLLITGFIQHYLPAWYDIALDYHTILGYFLSFALAYRLYLLFGSPHTAASWREFIPGSQAKQNILSMLRFYLSFARMPLPRWYAHNPVWSPVYLLLYIALLISIVSGFLLINQVQFSALDLYPVHLALAIFIFWFSVLHIMASVLHDAKGTTSDISAMLNGHRIFIIEKPAQTTAAHTSQKVTFPPVFTPKDKKDDNEP